MADLPRISRPPSAAPEEAWEKSLLEGEFSGDMDLDFFDLGTLADPEGFPLNSGMLAAAASAAAAKDEDRDDAATLSSAGGDESESRELGGGSDSESSSLRQLRKRSKRERDVAVRGRKRKRAQMERLLHTTRQLQAQNAQLLRTLGTVQQMAEEKDMDDVAAVAASASNASLTELEATEQAKAQRASPRQIPRIFQQPAGVSTASDLPPAFKTAKPEPVSPTESFTPSAPLAAERASLQLERLQILREAVRILNTGDADKVLRMCDLVHHRYVTLLNPDLSHEIQGLSKIHTYWRHLNDAFPDFTLLIDELVAEDEVGEKLRLRWTFKGTQVEPFLPVLPAGRSIELSGEARITFKDLKIARHIWSWNHTGLLLSLIGYETDAKIGAPATKIPDQAEDEGNANELRLPGPRNLNSRIADTISSMVRSISAGNLALQEANHGSLAKNLKRAKSSADVGTLPAPSPRRRVETLLRAPRAAPSVGSDPRPKPRPSKAQPTLPSPLAQPMPRRGAGAAGRVHAMQNMLQLSQPYLLHNGHMLPPFPMRAPSGMFVGLPQTAMHMSGRPNLPRGGSNDGAPTFSR